MNQKLLNKLKKDREKDKKSFAVLLDPDKLDVSSCIKIVNHAVECKIDYFLVGGSLMTDSNTGQIINTVKAHCQIPVILFPGNNYHIETQADAILFLSLISGRNPDYLIGQHVVAAPILKKSHLEILPTGYMLVDSGSSTTVSYVSNTTPIPHDKPSIAACTAMAGEMLGLQLMYLDGGSGARNPVSKKMISTVRKSVDTPIIVGGGINNADKAAELLNAGADTVVIGNGIEKDLNLMVDVAERVRDLNTPSNVH